MLPGIAEADTMFYTWDPRVMCPEATSHTLYPQQQIPQVEKRTFLASKHFCALAGPSKNQDFYYFLGGKYEILPHKKCWKKIRSI